MIVKTRPFFGIKQGSRIPLWVSTDARSKHTAVGDAKETIKEPDLEAICIPRRLLYTRPRGEVASPAVAASSADMDT
jgi:hypothetical protein